MAVSDYSTTPASNTSISGINVAEGCPPANINNAIRQLMADLKSYTATVIPFTPAGGIAATTVAAAIAEARADAIAAIPGAATTAAAGLMSAADKTKLNDIASGAQVNRGIASQAQAEAGSDNTVDMTPLRTTHWGLKWVVGMGQGYSDVKASRATGTVYTNTTGRVIAVAAATNTGSGFFEVSQNGVDWLPAGNCASSTVSSVYFLVPSGWRYRCQGASNISHWVELR